MKTQLLPIYFLLFLSISMRAQVPENERMVSLKISPTTYTIPFKDVIQTAGHGDIIGLQIPTAYEFLKNIPNLECDLSAINSFKMNQYVRNDSIPNQIYMFVGINEKKKEKYIAVDANNNHDFSDDELHTFSIPEEPLSREEKLEKCIPMQITLDPLKSDIAHIGVDPFNYFSLKDGMPQDERLRVVITFGDYMQTKTRIEDIDIEIDTDGGINLFDRKLKDKTRFDIRFQDNANKLSSKSFAKGDTIHLRDRLFQLTNIEHPNIHLEALGLLSDSSVGSFVPTIYAKHLETNDNIQLNKIIKDKYIFIDFWGSWCGPCISSIPKLKGFYENIKDRKDVLMIGLALERESDLEKLSLVIDRDEVGWENFWMDSKDKTISSTVKKLNINGYPTYLIIDNTGKIVYKGVSMFKTEEAINFFMNMIDN